MSTKSHGQGAEEEWFITSLLRLNDDAVDEEIVEKTQGNRVPSCIECLALRVSPMSA